MNHPRDIELIELANGVSDEQAGVRLRAHLTECAACRAVYEQLEQLHHAMQPVAGDQPGEAVDLTARVLAAMEAGGAGVTGVDKPGWRIGPMTWRLAASVMIAAGVGAGASAMTRTPGQVGAVDEAGAAEQLGLGQLQNDSPAGLSQMWLTMPDEATVEKGSAG